MRHATTDERWRALFASMDGDQARVVATCVAAMEFEVRMNVDGAPASRFDRSDDPDGDVGARYVVEVTSTDWPHLAEVLDEIIAEQTQFDDLLSAWDQRSSRSRRRLLYAMIAIVGTLAVVGAIDL